MEGNGKFCARGLSVVSCGVRAGRDLLWGGGVCYSIFAPADVLAPNPHAQGHGPGIITG